MVTFTILTMALIPGQPPAATWAITERVAPSPWVVTERASLPIGTGSPKSPTPPGAGNLCGLTNCPCGCRDGKPCLCKYWSAMAEGRRTGKPVIVVFSRKDCRWCDKLEQGPLVELAPWIAERFHVVHLKAEEANVVVVAASVYLYPTVVMCKGDGTILRKHEGYADAASLKAWLEPPAVHPPTKNFTSLGISPVSLGVVCVGDS